MTGKAFTPSSIDEHIGQRVQLRRMMMGMSQKDLASACGISFQQIQKYETAGNRISASRLFELSTALHTPVSFFFYGLPGNVEVSTTGRSRRVSEAAGSTSENDPLGRNESLELINMYWRLPEDQRHLIFQMLQSLSAVTTARALAPTRNLRDLMED